MFMKINEKFQAATRPVKILQFGEGNFLRCFVDWMIAKANEELNWNGNIVVVQPLAKGMIADLAKQDGLYTVLLNGIEKGQLVKETKVIDVLQDFINPYTDYSKYLAYAKSEDLQYIISNTTEAGIVYNEKDLDLSTTPISFPGKLLAFLKTRYEHFDGDMKRGLDIIPCELIDNNGDKLQEVLIKLAFANKLEPKFITWLEKANRFYNTLVDRIVPGYPRDEAEDLCKELGYKDNFMVKGEYFHLWVIEDHYQLAKKLPLDKILNVLFVNNVKPYKERKVKLLNGTHTLLVPVSYLCGHNTVLESIQDIKIMSFIKGYLYDEAIPTIDLPKDQMLEFANSVLDRYANPFIHHELMSIALNSIFKFKTRLFETLISNLESNNFPVNILYSFAALIVFYRGIRDGLAIPLNDDYQFIELFKSLWNKYENNKMTIREIVVNVLQMKEHWSNDLSTNQQVVDFMERSVIAILNDGIINKIYYQELKHR